MLLILLIIVSFSTTSSTAQQCFPRRYKSSSSVVCVCNATHCDEIPKIRKVSQGFFEIYTSSKEGLRFYKSNGKFSSVNQAKKQVTIEIDRSKRFQKIHGFGGAFTDATGINVKSLSKETRENLLKAYFSPHGVQYSLCRVPMGATDFSIKPYTYRDSKLEKFKLQPEDFVYKIPLIRKAIQLSDNTLKLIASPWTAPPWMKTRNVFSGVSMLKNKHYQLWADYYIEFFDAYLRENISFWGLTTGNEPATGLTPLILPTTGWLPRNMAKWLSNNLGPTIRNSSYSQLKIIIHDDQRLLLPFLQEIFRDENAVNYADGVGVHWYWNRITPPNFLRFAKTPQKDLFLLGTEASVGLLTLDPVLLGSWERAEDYISNIFEDLQYGASGWIDWNMALNLNGGPVYTGFAVDSTIIVNATADEFYKQPIYYALGHFSKFLTPGSVRLKTTSKNDQDLLVIAFLRPDESVVVTIYNRGMSDKKISFKDIERGNAVVNIKAKSINSVIYW